MDFTDFPLTTDFSTGVVFSLSCSLLDLQVVAIPNETCKDRLIGRSTERVIFTPSSSFMSLHIDSAPFLEGFFRRSRTARTVQR